MINWKIINTKRADSDLCDIANYIKYNLQSPDTARKIVDAIVDGNTLVLTTAKGTVEDESEAARMTLLQHTVFLLHRIMMS